MHKPNAEEKKQALMPFKKTRQGQSQLDFREEAVTKAGAATEKACLLIPAREQCPSKETWNIANLSELAGWAEIIKIES